MELVTTKINNYSTISGLSNTVKVGKLIPKKNIPQWDGLDDQAKTALLHELGFDVTNFNYTIDILCSRLGDTPEVYCGEFIYGSERLDDEWLLNKIGGKNTASEEARFYHSRDMLAEMRSTPKSQYR